MNDTAEIKNEEIFQYFWELWEHLFHLDLTLAERPLDKQTIDVLGLSGKQIGNMNKALTSISEDNLEHFSEQNRRELIKIVKLMIQIKEKQLY